MVTPQPHLGADSSLPHRSPRTVREARLWGSNFLLLQQFRDREGHLRVPKQHVEDGHKLGNWISNQRIQKRKGTLSPDRHRRLNEIGFCLSSHEGRWDTMFRGLTQFKQREEDCNVVHNHIEHLDGIKLKLGAWLKSQRHRQGSELLDSQREKRLENLGVTWSDKRGESTIIQQVTTSGGTILNVSRRRRPPSQGRLWESNFLLLLQFRDREGHLRVPAQHVEDGQKLGAWISRNRLYKKAGTLCPENERRLKEIGFIWDTREEKWETML
jgi:hypothetical protein